MSTSGASIVIRGIGTHAPSQCVTNDELPAHLETSDEWIRTRTGIRQRYIAPKGEDVSEMSVEAAKKALAQAQLSPEDIDLIVVATMSPDYLLPASACLVQSKLGMRNVAAFDVHAACSGFIYTLEVATRMMQSGQYKNALVIGAEKMTSLLDWQDRTTCVLFGDGAGAAVLSKIDTPGVGVIDNLLHADGSRPEILYTPAGGTKAPITVDSLDARNHFVKMNGKEIFKVAVRLMADASETILKRNGMTFEDIDYIVPHQANTRIIESLGKHANMPREKIILNIDRYANTSAASIPLAMGEAVEKGLFKPGHNILLVAFGGGLTWATSLIKWH